jgi:hypothetical protein
MHKKIELLANIAIIIAAVLLVALAINKFFLSPKRAPLDQVAAHLKAGDKVTLPGFDWTRSERTLVMALSVNCHYCTESAPFYQQLTAEVSKHPNTHLLSVLPQTTEAGRKYLSELGITIEDVRQVPLNAVGVAGTPTLILVDKEGTVKRVWVGKLPESAQSEVISQL